MTSETMDKGIRFDGRILLLSQDPDIIERQLGGEDMALAEALPLRTDVSTDEITPAWICDPTTRRSAILQVARGPARSGWQVHRRLRRVRSPAVS
jgi:hypothetical protein